MAQTRAKQGAGGDIRDDSSIVTPSKKARLTEAEPGEVDDSVMSSPSPVLVSDRERDVSPETSMKQQGSSLQRDLSQDEDIVPATATRSDVVYADQGPLIPHPLSHGGQTTSATVTDWGYGEILNKRVSDLVTYLDPRTGICAPTRMPKNCIWNNRGRSDPTDYLFQQGKSTPVLLWAVGKLNGVYLLSRDGEPERQANITFEPVHGGTLDICRNLLRKHTTGQLHPANEGDTVKVGRWMTRRVQGVSAEVDEFREIYDARDKLRPKSKMDKIPPADLKRGDLVVIEFNISRYKDRTMEDYATSSRTAGAKSSPSKSAARFDTKWRATFTLKSIYLLIDSEVEEVSGDDENIDAGIDFSI